MLKHPVPIDDLEGQVVKVHFHLQKQLFSVSEGGYVRDHTELLFLRDATFKVSQSGYWRANERGVRNVHAWMEGVLLSWRTVQKLGLRIEDDHRGGVNMTWRTNRPGGRHAKVAYNPFVVPWFRERNGDDFEIVERAELVIAALERTIDLKERVTRTIPYLPSFNAVTRPAAEEDYRRIHKRSRIYKVPGSSKFAKSIS